MWLLAWTPSRARAWLGDALARVWAHADQKRRRIILTNLRLCYPNLTDTERCDILRTHTRIACRVLIETAPLMFRSRDHLLDRVDVHGLDYVTHPSLAGRNLIFLSPHSPALEHCGMRLCLEHPLLTMVRTHNQPLADWAVSRMRTRFGALIFRHDASLLSLVRAVKRGLWFYYLPDEDHGNERAVFAPFFGVAKATIPMLGRLARATDAVVIPMRCAFDPDTNRFSLVLERAIHVPDGSTPEEDARITNALIEPLVDAAPEQYLWTHKMFRTRPPGEAPVY